MPRATRRIIVSVSVITGEISSRFITAADSRYNEMISLHQLLDFGYIAHSIVTNFGYSEIFFGSRAILL